MPVTLHFQIERLRELVLQVQHEACIKYPADDEVCLGLKRVQTELEKIVDVSKVKAGLNGAEPHP